MKRKKRNYGIQNLLSDYTTDRNSKKRNKRNYFNTSMLAYSKLAELCYFMPHPKVLHQKWQRKIFYSGISQWAGLNRKFTWVDSVYALIWTVSSFFRIMLPNFSLLLWRVAMTVRTLSGYSTTWGLKNWCVWYHTDPHIVLGRFYLTVYILSGGGDQKGLHAGWDWGGGAAGGWGGRGGALRFSTQCWT